MELWYLHWEQATEADRRAVYRAYTLLPDDGTKKATWEQANSCWAGSNFWTIKFTFCPVGYWG